MTGFYLELLIPFSIHCDHTFHRSGNVSRFASATMERTRLPPQNGKEEGGHTMLKWAIIFFVVALVAAVFGFTGIAGAAAGIAEILFFIFVVLFVISLIMAFTRGGTRT